MKDEKLLHINVTPRSPISLRSSAAYELFLQQQRKLGRVATRAFDDIRDVLHKEISLPSGGQLLEVLMPGAKAMDHIAQLRKRARHTHQILAHVHSVFPMTLFPHSIIVDRSKVTIVKRDFFWTASAISMQIDDILNVSTSVGPLFGSLTIASRVMNSVDHFKVNYLWRGDALFLKQFIQGYIIARRSGINTEQLTRSQMLDALYELGRDT